LRSELRIAGLKAAATKAGDKKQDSKQQAGSGERERFAKTSERSAKTSAFAENKQTRDEFLALVNSRKP
jgi:hypothetical protein